MSRTIDLIKNTIIIFIGKIATQMLIFFLLPIYTKFLNPSDYGYVDVVITYIQLLIPIVILELDMGVFRFLLDQRQNKDGQKEIISSTFFLIAKLTIIFLMLGWIISYFINIKLFHLIIANIFATILSSYLLQISRGFGKNVNYSIACFITGLVTIISNIILIIYLNKGAESILISATMGNLICSIYLFISLRMYNYLSLKKYNQKRNKEILKYSIPLIPNFLSWWIVNVSDRTLISAFLGVNANGIYAAATKFPSIINSLFSIFSLSWTESASLHIDDNDRDDFFSKVANNVIKIFGCLSIGLITAMPMFFSIFIKEQYYEAYFQIPILILGSFFNCIVLVYSAIYVAKKMTKQVALTSLFSAIINIFINLIFIKKMGLYAASISTVIAYISMAIYRHFDLKKFVKIKYERKTISLVTVGLIIAIISYYINDLYFSLVTLILTIILSILLNADNINAIKLLIERKIKN